MLVSFKLQMESDILTRWAAWNAVPLDMNGLGQFRDGETHVSPLAGLAFFGLYGFPPLPQWATICRPSGTPGTMQLASFFQFLH